MSKIGSKTVLLECPFCEHKQTERFKDGKTIDLYCNCNINAYMSLSFKKDAYIKYSYLVTETTQFWVLKEMTKIKNEKQENLTDNDKK